VAAAFAASASLRSGFEAILHPRLNSVYTGRGKLKPLLLDVEARVTVPCA
jgi:hypothetical protein